MEFEKEIMELEFEDKDSLYITKKGSTPVIITAVHTYKQDNKEKFKKSEIFTGSITKYVADKVDCFYYIKQMDNGVDSNSKKNDIFKKELLNIIKENNIELVIDIHGAKRNHDFDIEIGTLNNKTIEKSILRELEGEFKKFGITNIRYNNLFKGGGITRYVYSNSDTDIFQMEINKKYRSNSNLNNVKKICDSMISFIENNYSNK